jgi:hypothetical protein
MTLKFNKHNVTDGTRKARITYSAFQMISTGQDCVTLYAKDWQSGRTLGEIFADLGGYQNDTDSSSDYFEKGRVRIIKGSPLYAAALARCSN